LCEGTDGEGKMVNPRTRATVRLTLLTTAPMVMVFALNVLRIGSLGWMAAGASLVPAVALARLEWSRSSEPAPALGLAFAVVLAAALAGWLAPVVARQVPATALDGVLQGGTILAVLLFIPTIVAVTLNSKAADRHERSHQG
jgi:hypothetical protein